jgi:hypothetical protein
MDLDDLPLDVLLALQDAMTDPTESGAERARQRAAGAGFHVAVGNAVGEDGALVLGRAPKEAAPPGDAGPAAPRVAPVPQPEAEPGVDAVELPLDGGPHAGDPTT